MSDEHLQAAINEAKQYREFFGSDDVEKEVSAAVFAYLRSQRKAYAAAHEKKRNERRAEIDGFLQAEARGFQNANAIAKATGAA